MKNSILALSLVFVLFSCKKDEPANDFKATEVTGNSYVSGQVTKPAIKSNGSGGWVQSTTGASGIRVNITVNRSALYPNSTAQGADVYSAVTDGSGYYGVSVKSNANGVPARLSIDNYMGSIDTLENGVSRPGQSAVFQGLVTNITLYMGHNAQVNHSF